MRVNHTVRNIVIALIVVAVMSAGRVVERGDVQRVRGTPAGGDQAVHRHGIRFGHRLDHLRVLGRRCAGARLSRGELSRSSDVIDFGTAADPIGYEDAIAAAGLDAVRGRQGGDAMSPWSHAYDIAGHQTDWTVIRKSTRR
ncbi:MAG: hypothetical protein ACLRL4_08730 [Bifidobacterium bifidum]